MKMIYIDPPYNTSKEFVYSDNFSDNVKNYLELTEQTDEEGNKFATNTETSGRYHTNWLNMMYPRLKLARDLLKEDGVIFISIDDHEVANLRKICDEIFGEDNFVAELPRLTKKAGKTTDLIAKNNDYIISYAKSENIFLNKNKFIDLAYNNKDEYEKERGKYKLSQTLDYGSIQYSPSLDYEIIFDSFIFRPGGVSKEEMIERQKRNPVSDFCWRWSEDLYKFGLENGFIVVKESRNGKRIYTKTYEKAIIDKDGNGSYYIKNIERSKPTSTIEFIDNLYSNDNSRKDIAKLFKKKVFEYSKPVNLIKKLTYIGSRKDKEEIVLDFFAGSGTTAHAVMQQNAEDGGNRKYIMVQLPEKCNDKSPGYKAGYENIAEIAKDRIRRAAKKIKEEHPDYDGDLGFKVFKLASSNIKEWDVDMDIDKDDLYSYVDNIRTDRSEEDVLYEIMLKYGLDLTLPIDTVEIAGQKVFSIGLGQLIVCLGNDLTVDLAHGIIEHIEEMNPEKEFVRIIFKDNGFKDDIAKTNILHTLKQSGFDNVVSI